MLASADFGVPRRDSSRRREVSRVTERNDSIADAECVPHMLVAGADFGTLCVRVSIFDSAKGRLGRAPESIRCSVKKKIPTTPRNRTPITCAR